MPLVLKPYEEALESWKDVGSGLTRIPACFIKPHSQKFINQNLCVKKGAILDWSDYFFLHYMPASLRNQAKWPAFPPSLRIPTILYMYDGDVDDLISIAEYAQEYSKENPNIHWF